jgi:hypothetical protein
MTLYELKQILADKIVPHNLIIFTPAKSKAPENKFADKAILKEEADTRLNNFYFLANAYVEALCDAKNCNKIEIESIFEPLISSMALVVDYENNICVHKTETFDTRADNYADFINTVVICEKVEKELVESLQEYIIEIPELSEWHIIDYIKQMCPTLSDEEALWLTKAAKKDLLRITNELDKVLLFPKNTQKEIISEIKQDPNTDLITITFTDIKEAIETGNKTKLLEYYFFGKHCKFDPIALTNSLLSEYKLNLLIRHNSGASPQDLNTSEGNYKRIKYYGRQYPLEYLKNAIKFLSNIDLRLKASELEMSNETFIDYLISNLIVR